MTEQEQYRVYETPLLGRYASYVLEMEKTIFSLKLDYLSDLLEHGEDSPQCGTAAERIAEAVELHRELFLNIQNNDAQNCLDLAIESIEFVLEAYPDCENAEGLRDDLITLKNQTT